MLGSNEYSITKKITLFLGFLLLAGVTVFPDEDAPLPKNTITVDVGPTVFFLLYTGISHLIDNPGYAFGVAAQYERQIMEKVSATGRFEYGIMDMSESDLKWRISSISAEGQGRYFPGMGTFFLGGSLGYVYVFTDFSTTDREIKPAAHYFKFGGKLGWRIDFDKPGGFVFEPAVGCYGSVGTSFKMGYEEDFPILGGTLNFMTNILTRVLFVDGLRFSLGFGYRF
jgi:hypothetical protein